MLLRSLSVNVKVKKSY